MPSSSRNTKPHVNVGALSDSQVIALLVSGEQSVALRAYFGELEYVELRQLARRVYKANQGAAKKRSAQARVYLLPGMMGSKLGWNVKSGGKTLNHEVWLNPEAIAAGELLTLALPSKRNVQPVGVILPGYLKLKLRLMAAGFDVVLHPFDWRKSVLDSGKQLLQKISRDRTKKIMIVGHSMGGLVARAALAKDTKHRIARVVQIGAPNYGSFALVQALRGAYPTVRKVAALDPAHTTDQLVRHVFRTLPGLYELLPAAQHANDLDLLQLDSWPVDLSGPDATLLGTANRTRSLLGEAREGCFHIIGVDQETVTSARKRSSGLEYAITHDGDGTVPRGLAEWSGAGNWYVPERHGSLTSNSEVGKAIIDLLTNGRTRRLQTEWQPRRDIIRWATDKTMRRAITGDDKGKVAWQELSLEERRRILEPVISPEFHGAVHRLIAR